MCTTSTPNWALTVKDYRADFVHAPFFRHLSTPSLLDTRGFQPAKIACALNPKRYLMTATHNPQAATDQARAAYVPVRCPEASGQSVQ